MHVLFLYLASDKLDHSLSKALVRVGTMVHREQLHPRVLRKILLMFEFTPTDLEKGRIMLD